MPSERSSVRHVMAHAEADARVRLQRYGVTQYYPTLQGLETPSKISGTFRSEAGATAYYRICSYLARISQLGWTGIDNRATVANAVG
jgi:hypothetical protein